MKGWLFTKTHDPLRLIEKEDPKAGKGQVVVDVKATGVCLTDIHMLDMEYYMNIATGAPVIIGHECAGIVAEVGEGVHSVKVGDRVAIEHTIDAATHECIGFTHDGGYATKILVNDFQCVPMPDEVSFAEGASCTCAGETAYHAVFGQGEAKEGTKIGFIGIGGIGQYAVAMAAAKGCIVYAASRKESARQAALELGAVKVAENITEFEAENLDVIIDLAGTKATLNDAIHTVKYGGTVVMVGMADSDLVIENASSLNSLILKEVSLKGSSAGTAEDIKGIFELIAAGKFKLDIKTIPFEDLDKGVDLLRQGRVAGKLVAVQD